MLPTAACHLLPFRSQTSHQLPPLLQSQTPFVSLCYLCSLLSLIYCPLWNTGRVKCKLADQGKQQKTEVKLKTALCYSALSMWGDCAITRHLTPPPPQETETEHSCCWRQAALSDGKEAQVIFVTSSGSRSERQAGSDASLVSTLVSQAPRTCSGGCWLFFSKPKAFTLSSMSYLI